MSKHTRLTKQNKGVYKMEWIDVTNGTEEETMTSILSKYVDLSVFQDNAPPGFPGQRLFTRKLTAPAEREIDESDDDQAVKQGYIAVTPLTALSKADPDCYGFFEEWLPGVRKLSIDG